MKNVTMMVLVMATFIVTGCASNFTTVSKLESIAAPNSKIGFIHQDGVECPKNATKCINEKNLQYDVYSMSRYIPNVKENDLDILIYEQHVNMRSGSIAGAVAKTALSVGTNIIAPVAVGGNAGIALANAGVGNKIDIHSSDSDVVKTVQYKLYNHAGFMLYASCDKTIQECKDHIQALLGKAVAKN